MAIIMMGHLMDDFIWRALIAGTGVALIAGPIGCFIVWRRMAYFGATLAHAALLGVALGFLFEFNITLGIIFVSVAISFYYSACKTNGSSRPIRCSVFWPMVHLRPGSWCWPSWTICASI